MRKRILSIVFAFAMMLAMMPTVAMALVAPTGVYVGGEQFTSGKLTITGGDGTAAYDPASNTLTLNNYTYEGAGSKHSLWNAAVYYTGDSVLTIVLNGENTIACLGTDGVGLYCTNVLIEGEGSLDVFGSYYGTMLNTLTVESGTVNVSSGDCTGDHSGDSIAIRATDNITINGGKVTAASGVADYDSYAIYSENITISGGKVTATGGKTEEDSYGIYADKDLNISGGEVAATGGEATSGNNAGIYVDNNLNISDGKVTATGGKATSNDSAGIYGYGAGLEITGGEVTAKGGEAKDRSMGLYFPDDDIEISGGEVTAIGSKAGESYGIYLCEDLIISGGKVIAKSGIANSDKGMSVAIYSDDGDITIKEATVTAASGEGSASSAICAYGNISMEEAAVIATGGAAKKVGYGIFAASGNITIKDTEVKATGGDVMNKDVYQTESAGIKALEGDISISGGTVTALGGDADAEDLACSYGIYNYNENYNYSSENATMTIKGAEVTAIAGVADAGHGINTHTLHIENSDVTAVGIQNGIYTSIYYGDDDTASLSIKNSKVIAKATVSEVAEEDFERAIYYTGVSIEYENGYKWRMSETGSYATEKVENDDFKGHLYFEIRSLQSVIKVEDVADSTVTVDKSSAATGESVTITVTVPEGKEVDKVVVKDENGNAIEVKDNGDGTYTYAQPEVDTSIEVTFKGKQPSSDSSGSSGKKTPKYDITINSVKNGNVTVNDDYAKRGQQITVTVTPDAGYELKELIITDKNGNKVEYENGKKENTFVFVMPKCDVSIDASFVKVEEAAEEDILAEEKTEIILTIDSKVILVNGVPVVNDVAPVIKDGRTFLPIRVIAETLGATVIWNEVAQTVTITKDSLEMAIYIGQPYVLVNGAPVELDVPAYINADRTYLPIRFIAENMGATVDWDAAAKTVKIVPGK